MIEITILAVHCKFTIFFGNFVILLLLEHHLVQPPGLYPEFIFSLIRKYFSQKYLLLKCCQYWQAIAKLHLKLNVVSVPPPSTTTHHHPPPYLSLCNVVPAGPCSLLWALNLNLRNLNLRLACHCRNSIWFVETVW